MTGKENFESFMVKLLSNKIGLAGKSTNPFRRVVMASLVAILGESNILPARKTSSESKSNRTVNRHRWASRVY